MVRSSLRRVLRLSHLEDMHGSDASVYVPSVGSLWILEVVVAISLGLVLNEMIGVGHEKWWLTGTGSVTGGYRRLTDRARTRRERCELISAN